MKTERRFAVIGGTILIIMFFAGLGIAEVFAAGGDSSCGSRFRLFAGGFHRHHGLGEDMPGFVLKRLDRKIKELNLTAAQQAKYDELRAQLKERLPAAKEDRLKFRETVRTELAKESPDVAVLNATMKKKIEGVSGTLQDGLDLFADFYSALDEGRKQKVLSWIRKRMAAQDACREEKQ
jgi:Spy/CpxP family protein refolding chaperone